MTVYLNDMFDRLNLKKKLEKSQENFNLRDFFGFSALIFGLLLSNTSMNKPEANAQVKTPTKIEKNAPTEKAPKVVKKDHKPKISKKKKVLRPKKGKRQQVTAATKD